MRGTLGKEGLVMVDRSGQQLGNYRLLSLLGQGGFAEVYLGEHVFLKKAQAIAHPEHFSHILFCTSNGDSHPTYLFNAMCKFLIEFSTHQDHSEHDFKITCTSRFYHLIVHKKYKHTTYLTSYLAKKREDESCYHQNQKKNV